MRSKAVRRTGIAGWLVIAAFATLFDCLVIAKGKESLSGAIWSSRTHPFYGPALAGFWAGISYHLFIDKPQQLLGVSDGS